MTDVGQWYRGLPRFTRYWLTATVGLSLAGRFGIPPLKYLYFSRELVFNNLQIWRGISALFAYPLTSSTGFHFLFNCYFITQYSARMEKDQFGRSPADFLYMLLLLGLLSNIGAIFFNVYFMMDILVIGVVYVWCHLNKDVIVNFWFGSRFKSIYLPWVLAGIDLIMKGSLDSLIGIFIGHTYYFLKFQYPQELGGNPFLETPRIIKQYVPDLNAGMGGFGIPPESRAPPRQAAGNSVLGNTWGRGNTLGRN